MKRIISKKKVKIYSYRPRYELNKIRWEFNPNDSDLNPKWSIPHGDDIAPRYHTLKLNIDTGAIYTATGYKFFGKLTKKELERLNADKNFLKVKEQARKNREQVKLNKEVGKNFQIELEYIPAKQIPTRVKNLFKV